MGILQRPKPLLNHVARSSHLAWEKLDEDGITGVFIKRLKLDTRQKRYSTILLKFEPDAKYPTHSHPGGEAIFVLEGRVRVGNEQLEAGDYLYTAKGNVHNKHSKEGYVLLLNVPKEMSIIKV